MKAQEVADYLSAQMEDLEHLMKQPCHSVVRRWYTMRRLELLEDLVAKIEDILRR